MLFLKKLFPYFFSLMISSLTALFFISVSIVFISYLYKKLGDSFSWDNGFNSWNPFYYIEPVFFLLFLFTGLLISYRFPPFFFLWDDGYKGILQRIAYFIAPVLFHLIIACVILFIGCLFFKVKFLFCSLAFRWVIPDIRALFFVINLIQVRGILLIGAMFFLYTISFNVYLAMVTLFFSIINYLMQYSFFGDSYKDKIFLAMLFLIFVIFMGGYIYNFLWKCISIPVMLLLF